MTVLFLCRQNAGRSQMAPAMLAGADVVISMGCDDPAVCDYPGRKVEDWGIEDPSGKPIGEVRRIRDLLRARVEELARRLQPAPPEAAPGRSRP